MTIQREIIHVGHDNTIDRKLLADGVAVDLSSVTRMTLTIGDVVIDAASDPAAFDWTTRGSSGIVSFDIGTLLDGAGVTIFDGLEGRNTNMELVVYDPSNTNGIVWGQIPVAIKG